VTWQYDNNDIDYGSPEEPEGKRRALYTIAGVFMLAIIGTGSAFVWRAYYPSFAFGRSPASTEPKTVGLAEFQAFQQQINSQMQANAQILAAQQADVKRLSDQMATISAKMETIQSSIASARAALPAVIPTTTKKPAKPKPSAISTGGGPPPPVQLTH
jgi:uncharacterized coiled-coil protein SlyX